MSNFNSMNKAYILGRLGKDPEVRYSQSGIAIANFSVATSENYKNQSGEYEEKRTWHQIVVFKNQAENCAKFLKKGSLVMVEGKIQNRSYTDKSGNERYISEIVADVVRFLDSKENSNSNQSFNKELATKKNVYDIDDDDDIPF